MPPNLTGQTLDRYRLIERLGQGENAVAYKAVEPGSDRPVTLKVISSASRDARERLRRESVTLAQFRHPGIRRVYGLGTILAGSSGLGEEVVFAVLEYAEGSLRGLMSDRFDKGRVFARAEVVRYLRPVADVLDYLHGRGWVHLDVKPENVMIIDGQRIALADFGIAQPFGKAREPGTPGYASPELLGGEMVGPPADVFALAAVAYEMLVGQPPFRGTPIERISATRLATPARVDRLSPYCSNSLGFVVQAALTRNPRKRSPRRAGAFVGHLDRADTMTVRLPTLPRRRPVIVVGIGMLLCTAVGFGVWRPWSAFVFGGELAAAQTPAVVKSAATPSPMPEVRSNGAQPGEIASLTAPTFTVVPTATLKPTATPAPTGSPTPRPTPGMACTNAERLAGAAIVSPGANARLKRGQVPIRGTADLPGMTEYEFYVRDPGQPPDSFAWRVARADSVKDGLLWTWNAADLAPGQYMLRLRVKLNNGQYKDCDVPVTLE
jgi:serine/threonine protein kinase